MKHHLDFGKKVGIWISDRLELMSMVYWSFRRKSGLTDQESCLAFLKDMANRWLAHDGLWFQAVEKGLVMEAARRI
jgi:hypothetical protein